MAHNFAQPSAPTEHYRPVPPVRSEFASDPLQQGLLSDRPPVPERMDIRPKPLTSTVRSSGVNILAHIAYITPIFHPIIH